MECQKQKKNCNVVKSSNKLEDNQALNFSQIQTYIPKGHNYIVLSYLDLKIKARISSIDGGRCAFGRNLDINKQLNEKLRRFTHTSLASEYIHPILEKTKQPSIKYNENNMISTLVKGITNTMINEDIISCENVNEGNLNTLTKYQANKTRNSIRDTMGRSEIIVSENLNENNYIKSEDAQITSLQNVKTYDKIEKAQDIFKKEKQSTFIRSSLQCGLEDRKFSFNYDIKTRRASSQEGRQLICPFFKQSPIIECSSKQKSKKNNSLTNLIILNQPNNCIDKQNNYLPISLRDRRAKQKILNAQFQADNHIHSLQRQKDILQLIKGVNQKMMEGRNFTENQLNNSQTSKDDLPIKQLNISHQKDNIQIIPIQKSNFLKQRIDYNINYFQTQQTNSFAFNFR